MALNLQRMKLPAIEGLLIDGDRPERHMLALTQDGIAIGEATPTTSTETIPGRTGLLDVTLEDESGAAYAGMREITLSLYAAGGEDDIIAAKQWLGNLNGKNTTIQWRTLPGEYRGRLVIGAWNDTWIGDRLSHSTVEATMTAMPYLYGHPVGKTLTEGQLTINVKGNRPCWPAWSLTPKTGAKTVTISDSHGHSLTVNAAQTLSGQIAIISSPSGREVRINGNLRTPTLESDYFPLLPGANTIRLAGCTGHVTYEPLTMV